MLRPKGRGKNLENNIVQRKGQKEKLSFLQRDLYKNNLQKIGKEEIPSTIPK